ncbi:MULTISPECIES: universal stress protein [Gammaproteobacteria]|uniref:universal stress protein n=1 Tax=Gammaproteobacteria TaxID=1236 RepID=UPI001ADC9F54|nr:MULTISPECIES: universal stress protein [Gammaproteobacteria]MBO9479934.1 universal stress protein [Salinisphaera sp. G21_0]MBO9492567.1 universal stress protein [Thalassotalea sp. G20_0]
MRGITKVLAVVDTRKDQQLALERASQICRITGAALHILAPNPRADGESMVRLEALAKPLMAEGQEVYLHETWNGSVIETIIHVRQMERCHLIVKDAKLITALKKAFSTPEDWSLLRRCRVPVLLVQDNSNWTKGKILAAINADPRDHYHSILNQAILQYATDIASEFSSELHLATAYPTTMLAIQDHGDGRTDKDYYEKHCQEYAREFNLNEDYFHIEPGPTETMIPALLQDIDAKLLILGTHARTGISALAIGNTAEQLISEVKTDILVLQPKHHMIPLERELGK